MYRIFSDPIVLQDCRDEVTQAVEYHQDGTSTVDLGFVLNSCPILLSTYQEVFRFHGPANSVRVVSEDYMLDNKCRAFGAEVSILQSLYRLDDTRSSLGESLQIISSYILREKQRLGGEACSRRRRGRRERLEAYLGKTVLCMLMDKNELLFHNYPED